LPLLTTSPPISPPFPYTTLFRSEANVTALPVDPGSYACDMVVGRQNSASVSVGSVGSTLSESAIANSSPVLASITTMLPHLALRSEEHTSELQSRFDLVCRLLLE